MILRKYLSAYEHEFLDRFQGSKAFEIQRYMINSKAFFFFLFWHISNSLGGGGMILSKT